MSIFLRYVMPIYVTYFTWSGRKQFLTRLWITLYSARSLARLLNVSRNKYRVFDSNKGEVAWMLVKLNKINIISKSFSGGQRLMSCRARPKLLENTAWLKISIFSIPPVIQSYGHESRLTIPQKNWHPSLNRWLKGFGHTKTYSQDISCPNHNTNFGTPCRLIIYELGNISYTDWLSRCSRHHFNKFT